MVKLLSEVKHDNKRHTLEIQVGI